MKLTLVLSVHMEVISLTLHWTCFLSALVKLPYTPLTLTAHLPEEPLQTFITLKLVFETEFILYNSNVDKLTEAKSTQKRTFLSTFLAR